MLKLRRATVVSTDPLEIELRDGGERRRAWADEHLVGPAEVGDDVVVNVAAIDLGLGSGGFDVIHVNLTRGLEGGETPPGVHVMKLNYSSLQHPVDPVELPADAPVRPERRLSVLALPLHGHLAPAAWAVGDERAGLRVGYIQTAGAALPGGLSRDVVDLKRKGLIAETITVAPCSGGDHEAISVPGALHAAADRLGWSVALVGPGPGILGSATRYGHGGMAALEALHAALGLGMPVMLSPRLSSSDPRPRHRGVSHHTRTVLDLALGEVRVALPVGTEQHWPDGDPGALVAACGEQHLPTPAAASLQEYGASGLPRRTMGRDIEEDPLFFAAPLAAGRAIARIASS